MFNNNIGFAKKVKIVVGVIAIAISLGYLLVNFEIQGFNTAVELTTYLFNKPVTDYSINVPHAQNTIQNYIRWGFGQDAKLATAIFRAESGLRCDSVSKTGDYGLAQINLKAHPQYTVSQLLDCKTNLEIAARIYHQQGNFQAWSAYKNGSYKKFLN
jgi:hypothetical protein